MLLDSIFLLIPFDILSIVWADNGDMLSMHYSGTGALKADYTR